MQKETGGVVRLLKGLKEQGSKPALDFLTRMKDVPRSGLEEERRESEAEEEVKSLQKCRALGLPALRARRRG